MVPSSDHQQTSCQKFCYQPFSPTILQSGRLGTELVRAGHMDYGGRQVRAVCHLTRLCQNVDGLALPGALQFRQVNGAPCSGDRHGTSGLAVHKGFSNEHLAATGSTRRKVVESVCFEGRIEKIPERTV